MKAVRGGGGPVEPVSGTSTVPFVRGSPRRWDSRKRGGAGRDHAACLWPVDQKARFGSAVSTRPVPIGTGSS